MYYDKQEPIKYIPSHRILAINRGEKEDFLKVKLEKPEEKILNNIEKDIIKGETQFTQMLKDTILDAFKRLIEPSIEREILWLGSLQTSHTDLCSHELSVALCSP